LPRRAATRASCARRSQRRNIAAGLTGVDAADILGSSRQQEEAQMATVDRQHQAYALFNARLKAEIRASITPALIAEHRAKPLGRHSDALERVLNFFRRPPAYALYSRTPMREWQLIRLPIAAGSPPAPLDDTVYTSEAEAMHALFTRHVDDLLAN
jgi:branched-chain amino acid transport system permease protein